MTIPARLFVFETLEAGRAATRFGRFVDQALIVLITLNVAAVVLETVPEVYAGYAAAFYAFETLSVVVFTIEYLLRVWSVTEHPGEKYRHPVIGRLRYMLTPMALIDLAVILPFYLSFFVSVDLRILRVVRLLRIARLSRYSAGMRLLFQVLHDEARNIGAALFVLIVMMVLAACLVFVAEHDAQPEAFGSIPAALWWAVVTVTTVGYGDVVPVTVAGKIFSGMVGILSVGMIALPAGILASGFNEALHRRRRRFEALIDELLDAEPLDDEGRKRLRDLQEDIDLSDTEAASILNQRHRMRPADGLRHCPHCGMPIHGHDGS
ncbi:MAG: ion transporter [Rhodospirillales bacterium]